MLVQFVDHLLKAHQILKTKKTSKVLKVSPMCLTSAPTKTCSRGKPAGNFSDGNALRRCDDRAPRFPFYTSVTRPCLLTPARAEWKAVTRRRRMLGQPYQHRTSHRWLRVRDATPASSQDRNTDFLSPFLRFPPPAAHLGREISLSAAGVVRPVPEPAQSGWTRSACANC